MLKHFLLLATLILSYNSNYLTAQCPSTFFCDDSGVLCSIDQLNGFRCNNPISPNTSFPVPTLCFGAGVPHNLGWWAFVGNGSALTLTFNFDPASCESGQGIQAGAFEGRCDGSSVWDCNASCNTSTFSLSGATRNCEVYYVWVDGCNGDVCTYTMSVNGNGGPPTLPPLTSLTTRDKVCPCNEFEVCAPDLGDCEPTLEWTVNGVVQNRWECTLVSVPEKAEPGSRITVCLTATIGNPDNPAAICDQGQICTDFIVDSIDQVVEPCDVVCFEDQPYIWQGFPITSSCIVPPCMTRVQGSDGCCDDVSKVIVLLPPPSIGRKDTFICNVGIPFRAENGQVFADEVCDELIEFRRRVISPECPTSIQMCDTSYYLNIARFKYSTNPELTCGECDGELQLSANVKYDPDCPHDFDSLDIQLFWFNEKTDEALDTTGALDSIIVSEPGRYCAEIMVITAFDSCLILPAICIDVPEDRFPAKPTIAGDDVICNKSVGNYRTQASSQICEYLWSINSGQGTILTPNSLDSNSISVDWSNRQDSVGEICLTILSDCGIRDTCIIILFDKIDQSPSDTIILCPNDSVSLTEPMPLMNREWSNGDTSTSITIFNEGEICITGDPIDSSCTINKCYFIKKSDLILTDTFIENEWAPFKGEIRPVIQTNDSIIDIQWSNGDTTLNIDSLEADIYTLVITTKANCTYTFVFEIERTTSNKNVQSTHFTIKPNPSRDLFLHPVTDLSLVNTILLFSASGYSFKINNASSALSDLNTVPPGVYWIKLDLIDGNYQVLKWVKHE